MGDVEHRILDMAQHLGAYLLGVLAVAGAILRFWWTDRVLTRNKIDTNMEKVTFEIKKIREDNQKEHGQILEKMNGQHAETLQQMLKLHSSDE